MPQYAINPMNWGGHQQAVGQLTPRSREEMNRAYYEAQLAAMYDPYLSSIELEEDRAMAEEAFEIDRQRLALARDASEAERLLAEAQLNLKKKALKQAEKAAKMKGITDIATTAGTLNMLTGGKVGKAIGSGAKWALEKAGVSIPEGVPLLGKKAVSGKAVTMGQAAKEAGIAEGVPTTPALSASTLDAIGGGLPMTEAAYLGMGLPAGAGTLAGGIGSMAVGAPAIEPFAGFGLSSVPGYTAPAGIEGMTISPAAIESAGGGGFLSSVAPWALPVAAGAGMLYGAFKGQSMRDKAWDDWRYAVSEVESRYPGNIMMAKYHDPELFEEYMQVLNSPPMGGPFYVKNPASGEWEPKGMAETKAASKAAWEAGGSPWPTAWEIIDQYGYGSPEHFAYRKEHGTGGWRASPEAPEIMAELERTGGFRYPEGVPEDGYRGAALTSRSGLGAPVAALRHNFPPFPPAITAPLEEV